jgi:hypothetical protein
MLRAEAMPTTDSATIITTVCFTYFGKQTILGPGIRKKKYSQFRHIIIGKVPSGLCHCI